VWVLAFCLGEFVDWGLPSINSVVFAFVAYIVLGRLGLVRGVGVSRDMGAGAPVSDETPGVASGDSPDSPTPHVSAASSGASR
jgi:cytosine permease